jgi:hemoglobin-like flavoprotein
MTVSAIQKTLVQSSFAEVLPVADQAARRFYDRLFELDPTLRELFTHDMAEQRVKLMQMLQAAVRGLDRLEQLVPVLQQLAVRHVGYQVRNEHYATVGAALLWTLEQALGDAYSTDVHDAWVAVYGLISSVMMEAAGEALAHAGSI